MTSTLALGASRLDEIHAHLLGAYPEEGCGVLLGIERMGRREVTRIVGFDNRSPDSRRNRYTIAPEQFLAAERDGRAHGLDVLGVFHSHPDHPARPSAFDLEHAWPYYSYLIVSVRAGRIGEMASFRLAEDRTHFEPEWLETPDASGNCISGAGDTA